MKNEININPPIKKMGVPNPSKIVPHTVIVKKISADKMIFLFLISSNKSLLDFTISKLLKSFKLKFLNKYHKKENKITK